MVKRKEASIHPPKLPKRPETEEETRWPSPIPLPQFPTENTGQLLKHILDRLDAIEKRLETIEKLLKRTK